MTRRRRPDDDLVRSYVITGGRAAPTRNAVDVVTLVMARPGRPLAGLSPEKLRVVQVCGPGFLSVAEAAAHLGLPPSVLRVLAADLIDSGHLTSRAPITPARPASEELLREVLHGLRNL
jgi:hypothetical protein